MKYISIISLSVLMLLILSCDDQIEVSPKVYPFVVTENPVVSEVGTRFLANIIDLGDEEIIRYGFIWSGNYSDEEPLLQVIDIAQEGNYTYFLSNDLRAGRTYNVQAYIQTMNYEVYGNEITFESEGCLPLIVNNFSPYSGAPGTHVIFEGENFAEPYSDNIIKFSDKKATIIEGNKTSLTAVVPEFEYTKDVLITMESLERKVLIGGFSVIIQ